MVEDKGTWGRSADLGRRSKHTMSCTGQQHQLPNNRSRTLRYSNATVECFALSTFLQAVHSGVQELFLRWHGIAPGLPLEVPWLESRIWCRASPRSRAGGRAGATCCLEESAGHAISIDGAVRLFEKVEARGEGGCKRRGGGWLWSFLMSVVVGASVPTSTIKPTTAGVSCDNHNLHQSFPTPHVHTSHHAIP